MLCFKNMRFRSFNFESVVLYETAEFNVIRGSGYLTIQPLNYAFRQAGRAE